MYPFLQEIKINKPIKRQVKEIRFSLISPEEIKKMSVAKIVTPELYDIDGYPVDGGLMDLRLGAIDPGVRCRTCGGRLKECLGHPGSIDLARAVVHLKYIPLIMNQLLRHHLSIILQLKKPIILFLLMKYLQPYKILLSQMVFVLMQPIH